MKRRNFILLLGGASSGTMSVGTGAFSSMEAERGVSVNVANDENAYLRYEKPNDGVETEYGEDITLIRIRNQFGDNQELALVGVEYEYGDESVDDEVLQNVTVERYESPEDPDEELDDEDFTDVDEDGVAIERGSVSGEYPAANEDDAFGPGEWVRIVADAYVPPGETVDVEVTITVTGVGGSVSAQLFGDTRSSTLRGFESGIDDVIFSGGNAETDPSDVGTVEVEVRYGGTGNDGPRTLKNIHWDTEKKLNHALAGSDASGNLLAVRFPATGRVFVNPHKSSTDDGNLPADWDDRRLGTTRGDS